MPRELRLRAARPGDAEAIAALHVANWRTIARGSLSDAYLDGPVEGERRAFWRERLGHPRAGVATLLAEDRSGALAGFACVILDHDPAWGSLIDNLHVDLGRRGRGIGRLLMRAVGDHLVHALVRPAVHLFVLRGNVAASGFYARLGGAMVEQLEQTEPDGTTLPVIRVAWPSLTAFADAVGRGAPR